eukprot:IDg7075t1
MVRGASAEVPRGQKRRMSIDVDEAPAAQRSRAVDGARVDKTPLKNVSETLRLGFPFTDADATGPAKTVVVIRCPGRKTGRRTVMISNREAGEFYAQYPTGEPSED